MECVGWHWHQLDHMQTICASLHLVTQFLQARCSSWRPAYSVKTLKAMYLSCKNLLFVPSPNILLWLNLGEDNQEGPANLDYLENCH